jgi:hypothetical protein
MKPYILASGLILLLGIGAMWLHAAPMIGTVTVTPNTITVNTPTTITVTAAISDPLLLPQSVTLVRINGASSTVIGYLHDDGLAGDAVAGDHTFTVTVSLNEPQPASVGLQVSAAFSGMLRRITSPVQSITVHGLQLSRITNVTQVILQGTITALSSYYQGNFIFSDFQLPVNTVIKGSSVSGPVTVAVGGGTVGNVSQRGLLGDPLVVGQEVLLILDGPGADGKYTIPDGPLGTFHIQSDPTLGKVAIVDSAYDSMEMAYPLDTGFFALLNQSSQGQLSLAALISALSAQ